VCSRGHHVVKAKPVSYFLRLDSTGSEKGPVACCCEYDDDPMSSMKWNLFCSWTTVKVSALVHRIGFIVVVAMI
jgi:hypothetical protein